MIVEVLRGHCLCGAGLTAIPMTPCSTWLVSRGTEAQAVITTEDESA